MIKDTISAVKAAEEEASRILASAYDEADSIRHLAEEDKVRLIKENEASLHERMIQDRKAASEERETALEKARAEALQEAEALVLAAKPHMEKAIAAVTSALLD